MMRRKRSRRRMIMWRWKRSWIEEVREEDKVEQSEKD